VIFNQTLWWLAPVIPATLELVVGRLQFEARPGKRSQQDHISTNKSSLSSYLNKDHAQVQPGQKEQESI
jgi:hypothetical protein